VYYSQPIAYTAQAYAGPTYLSESDITNPLPPAPSAYRDNGYGDDRFANDRVAPPQVVQRADMYLIAFMDRTIQPALEYHVAGDEIVWTTLDHLEHRALLASVDRRFSEQINRDRRVEFRLP